ncbi:MAG: hypothetical protein GOMPHAMPRED_003476 [Gomphillus americanus]|uniref:Uncharacterized protein n=1 Tax=Gomphillus americanus TaxID=1940652 RepID=A0A8H3IQR1_9LECA|nr:MAG: hypothetical protein GOMPHAMPRED_003476 [Gomphillus americanus]
MAPHAVLAATALLATLSLTSAHDSSYSGAIYGRHLSEDSIEPFLTARAIQEILARRGLDDEEDLYIRDEPNMITREADADAEADILFEHDDVLFNYRRSIDSRNAEAEVDPLFEHDDILFNYKREADGGDSFFDNVEFFDILTRDIDTREADAEGDPDPMFEHDDILFNYKREALPDGTDSFFDDVEFFDLVARNEMSTRDASPDPDPIFEHDDILFNYRRSLDDPFEELEFTDLITRSTDPFDEIEFTDLVNRSDNPFDEIEFTDLISRSAERQADGSFTPWYQSTLAQARKGDYKSPGQLKADTQAQRVGGMLAGSNSGVDAGSGYSGAAAGGAGGHAFNEALDAGSAGASSMDAASMDAGGMGI